MGQRANLVVVERGRRTLYYDHWCANRLDVELFWGPELALEFVRQLDPVDEAEGWLDTTWCEGAAILDLDRRSLLWFAGEDILYDVPLRRAHLQLMAKVWRGWEVRWAFEGILSIADEVRLPRSRFLSPRKNDNPELWTFSDAYPEDNSVATSLERADGTLVVGRLCGVEDGLRVGEPLIDVIKTHSSETPLVWDGDFPRGGVHVDLQRRTLHMWWAEDTPALVELTTAAWPGWTIRWHLDQYETHLGLAGGKLALPVPADLPTRALKSVETRLSHTAGNPAREFLPRLGANAQINPATDNARGSVGNEDEKRALLASLTRSLLR